MRVNKLLNEFNYVLGINSEYIKKNSKKLLI